MKNADLSEVIKWNSGFSIGHETIDSQHREFVERTGEFLDTFKYASDEEFITAAQEFLYFLIHYSRMHFKEEEAFMKESHFDGLEDHVKKHGEFLHHLEAFERKLEGNLVDRDVADDMLNFAIGWLLVHIKKEDRTMYLTIQEGKAQA